MNVRWVRSNEIVLSLLAIAIVAVGALTALVVYEQDDQNTLYGQVNLGSAPAAATPPKESAPVPAGITDTPTTAITPDRANAPAMPAPRVAPVLPGPQVPPAPELSPAPQTAPIAQKPSQPKTHAQRRAHSVPAPDRPASVHPAIPAPAAEPATRPAAPAITPEPDRTPRKSDTPSKSAIPTGSSGGDSSETPQNSAPARTPTKDSRLTRDHEGANIPSGLDTGLMFGPSPQVEPSQS